MPIEECPMCGETGRVLSDGENWTQIDRSGEYRVCVGDGVAAIDWNQ